MDEKIYTYVYYKEFPGRPYRGMNVFLFWGRMGYAGQSGDRDWVGSYNATLYSNHDYRRLSSPARPTAIDDEIPEGGTWYSCDSPMSASLELVVAKKLREISAVDISTELGSELASRALCEMLNEDDWLRP